LIRWWFINRVEKGEGFRVREVCWGFYGQKDLSRGARSAERGFRAKIRESLDKGDLLPFSSAFMEVIEIPENIRVKRAIKWPL
jgi:hypothetical protein